MNGRKDHQGKKMSIMNIHSKKKYSGNFINEKFHKHKFLMIQ